MMDSTINPGQSGSWSNDNEQVLHISQSFKSEASPSFGGGGVVLTLQQTPSTGLLLKESTIKLLAN